MQIPVIHVGDGLRGDEKNNVCLCRNSFCQTLRITTSVGDTNKHF